MLTALGWLAVAALIAGNGLFVAAEFALTARYTECRGRTVRRVATADS
jgi:CBS domain containing-hemolysin-like protein